MVSIHCITIKRIIFLICASYLLFLLPHYAEAGILSKAPNNLGLLAYWSFNEGSGTVATDFSGNTHPGTLTNSPTWTSGRVGQALDFNGSDSEYVSVGNVGTGIQTVAFWINAETTTEPIIDLNGSATIEVSSGTVTANNFTSPTIYVDGAASSTLTTGWHHVAITTGTGINASAVDIGRISSSYFDGMLDEVRVYNRALSSTEVMGVHEAGVVRYGISDKIDQITDLLGWWTFDGPYLTSTNALDASGNAWNGTLGGGPLPAVGRVGQALHFDDTDDRVQLTDVDFTAGGFTLSAWFRTTSTEPEFSNIIGKEPNSGQAGRIYIMYAGSIDQIEGAINDGGFQGVSASALKLNDGGWHHALLRVTTSNLELFIDGVSQGTDTHDNSLTANNNPWYIGAKNGTTQNWDGDIDDVRIYNRALTDPEIDRLYNTTLPSVINEE